MIIGLITWLVLGSLVGFVASKVVNLRGDDPKIGIAAAIAGAFVAGILFSIISGRGVVPWDFMSGLFAVIGAVVGALVFHGIRSRSINRETQSVRSSY